MDYLTVKQVAELKGYTERYIKQLAKKRNWRAYKSLVAKIDLNI